jgi:hypothetical protein
MTAMLGNCDPTSLECSEYDPQANDFVKLGAAAGRNSPYAVVDPQITIVDDMTAKLTATFTGPPNTPVIGRGWISDADGSMVEGTTEELSAGTRQDIFLQIPEPKTPNGDLIACMRVEWPVLQTKHVVRWTLIEGPIVHPPKGKDC